jgi:hypothetical protein
MAGTLEPVFVFEFAERIVRRARAWGARVAHPM